MGQPADAPLTPELAKDACERNRSTAVVEGSIATLGSQYVLGLRARQCTTGDIIYDNQEQAPTKEAVLDVLSRMAVNFRMRVGESLASVEQHSTPLVDATTPSILALRQAAMSACFRTHLHVVVSSRKPSARGGQEAADEEAPLEADNASACTCKRIASSGWRGVDPS